MPDSFTQYLIILLIGLLFAKDYILPPILKRFGLGNGKNGHIHNEERIVELESHAHIANDEMREVKENLVALNTKMDIVLKHLKI